MMAMRQSIAESVDAMIDSFPILASQSDACKWSVYGCASLWFGARAILYVCWRNCEKLKTENFDKKYQLNDENQIKNKTKD